MTKYIDIEIIQKKTIKVDENDLNKAIKQAKNNLAELELTPDWINSRQVTFSENPLISESIKTIARLYSEKFNQKDLEEFIDMVFLDDDIKKYVLEGTLETLKNEYNIEIKKINI